MRAAANPPRPRRQSELKERLCAFAANISRDPARYNRTAQEAQEIQQAVDAYVEALSITALPDRKTRVTVNRKDKTREAAEKIHSKYYNLIKADPNVADDDKIAIGVRPMNLERTAIPVPASVPLLNVIGATSHKHTLRFRNGKTIGKQAGSETSWSSAKPFGAEFIQVYMAIGSDANQPHSAAREVGLFTKNPIVVMHEEENDCKKAVYWARWISPTGEPSRWSLPIAMTIAA